MRSQITANQAIDAVVDFFRAFGNASRGFYLFGGNSEIVVQVADVAAGKKQSRELQLIVVLSAVATSAHADSELIAKTEQIQKAISNTKAGINNALNGVVLELTESESAKIIPPEPQDPRAKSLFTLTLKY